MDTIERGIPNEPDLELPPLHAYMAPAAAAAAPVAPERPRRHTPAPTAPAAPTQGKVLPHDLDAERSLLGAMLLAPEAIEAGATLQPRDFYSPAHRHVHAAILAATRDHEPVDPVTIADRLRRTGLLDQIGGPGLLVALLHGTPATSNADRYAAVVRAHATRRQLLDITNDAAAAAHQLADPAAITDRLTAAVEAINTRDHTRPLPWEDVAAVMRGDVPPVTPQILQRTDGQALIYPGLTHWLMGVPGKGKTWVALAATAEQIHAQQAVIYLDYEGSARIVGDRLRVLGVPPDLVDGCLLYLRPGHVTPDTAARLTAAVEATGTTLVVVDGVAKALAAAGLSEDSAPDVLTWLTHVVNPLADAGAAVLMLDHVVKEKEGRGLWARGSGAKLGEVSGAAWVLEPDHAFSRTKPGRARLRQAKDREGHVGTDGEVVAHVHFRPDPAHGTLAVTLDPPTTESDRPFRPTALMERISRHIEALNGTGLEPTTNDIVRAVAGKKPALTAALTVLVAEGHVTLHDGPNRSRLHRADRPYREHDDPHSDHYQPPPT